MAIVHIAMFDAVNAIVGGYRSYTGLARIRDDASIDAAIASAAHDTLVALFPSQAKAFDGLLAADLTGMHAPAPKAAGIALGQQAAAAILALRAHDGSQHTEPRIGIGYVPGLDPGDWRPDPISQSPVALGAQWGTVTPFVLSSGDQFRAPLPPRLDSPEYAAAYNEVARMGGDGVGTPTLRTPEQTEIGIYWAYDGMPSLCAPPRLYNQIAMLLADQRPMHIAELARMMALVNIAMADAGIAIWESKYHYELWRPVTGIRESDPGTGPTGAGDGNPATIGNVTFTPLVRPPAICTGRISRRRFPPIRPGTPDLAARSSRCCANSWAPTPCRSRSSPTSSTARPSATTANRVRQTPQLCNAVTSGEENGQSRIYLGIHWAFDKTEGIALGRRVADYIFENALVPVREH
jgi:hypothetical protein